MATPDTPGSRPGSDSREDSSTGKPGPSDAQLSPSGGVSTGVSSVAIDRGLLNFAGTSPSSAPVSVANSGEPASDAEVMLRVKAGDESAFTYLIQKYRRPLVGFMYRLCHNAGTAEELAQEVFLRVYRSRSTYEPSAKFSTWLYRIATNLAVMMHKYQQMDYRQIAAVMKLSESATKSLLFRAYETLREQLKEFVSGK